jgi:hypothetical protein
VQVKRRGIESERDFTDIEALGVRVIEVTHLMKRMLICIGIIQSLADYFLSKY